MSPITLQGKYQRSRYACTAKLLTMLLLLLPAVVQAQFTYITNNGTITITGYTGSGGAVTIPNTINGLPVTSIGSYAFENNDGLNSVTIPNGVTSIGIAAFSSCRYLQGVVLPNNFISVGDSAFSACGELRFVLFRNTVNLGSSVFWYCRSLKQVYFCSNAPTVVGSDMFTYDNSAIVYYLQGTTGWGTTFAGLPTALWIPDAQFSCTTNANNTITITGYVGPGGDVTIPSTIHSLLVTGIGDSTFSGCWSLTSVTIPYSVTNIGVNVFAYCTGLPTITVDTNNPAYSSMDGVLFNKTQTALIEYPPGNTGSSYTIPNSVTSIGDYAFFNCTSVSGITIPNSVASIGSSAFSQCFSLSSAVIGNSVTNIGNYAFSDCGNLPSVTIPNGVTRIGDYAFSKCSSVTSVTIPNSVTSIGDYAFSWCSSVTNVTIGNGVTSIGSNAFYDCPSVPSVTIPNSVTGIGDYAFSWCSSVTNVTIPNNVTNIGEWAFSFCGLTSVTIPGSVTSIGEAPFAACVSLISITVNTTNPVYCSVDGVLFNQNQTALIQCPGGRAGSYTIPNSVTNIGGYAFYECTLTNVTIGANVTSIGEWAFSETSLTSVAIPNSVTSIGDFAFMSCTILTNVTIGNGVTIIGSNAFYDCPSVPSVTIPNSVNSIGDNAFALCTSLTGIYFQGNTPSIGSFVFYGERVTIYFLPGTTDWGSTFGGAPTALWWLPNPVILNNGPSFGVQSNGFGFTISWATNISVVVEACTNLANPGWSAVGTNTLTVGSSYFSDSQWTNYPSRFYRLRSP
jgi:hypothetical protein